MSAKIKRYGTDHNHLPVAERPPFEVGYNFRCPGCGTDEMSAAIHSVRTEGGFPDRPRWGFNGSLDKPTFTPSIFVKTVRITPENREAYDALPPEYLMGGVVDDPRFKYWCHSFVADGRIQFLGDCTHALAGQTVDLPSWD